MFLISEFHFDHVCYEITESVLNETGLTYAYNKCRDFLRLKTRPDVGLTTIISPKWIFLGVLTQPYGKTEKGYPVYLDGFSFSGLVSLQDSVPSWPSTAGLCDITPTVFNALEKSTYIPQVAADENPLTTDRV